MNVKRCFIDEKTLQANGMFSVVGTNQSIGLDTPYVSLNDLLTELQDRMNIEAGNLVSLPPDADRSGFTARWQVYKELMDELSRI